MKAAQKYKVLLHYRMKANCLPNAKYKLKALQPKERAECPGRIKLRLLILLPSFSKKVIESWKTYQIYIVFGDTVRKIKARDAKQCCNYLGSISEGKTLKVLQIKKITHLKVGPFFFCLIYIKYGNFFQ